MWEYAVVERSWPHPQALVDFLNLMDRTGWELVTIVAKPGPDHASSPGARAWYDCIFREPRAPA